MKTKTPSAQRTSSPWHGWRSSILIGALCTVVSLSQAADDILWSEDFESGDLGALQASPPEGFKIFTGSPIPGEELPGGSACAELPLSGSAATIAMRAPIYVDPTTKSRLSIKVYTDAGSKFLIDGYVLGVDNQQIMVEGTTNPQTYTLKKDDGSDVAEGPTDGWITMSTTFGPVGSGADCELPENALSMTFIVRILEGGEGKFYLDDLALEQITDPAPKTENKP